MQNLLKQWLLLSLSLLAACAVQTPAESEVGVAHLALSGAIPGVKAMTLSLYDGPVTEIAGKSPTFQPLVCSPYANEASNRIKLSFLKASTYTIYVELYSDGACQKRMGVAWRGNVAVESGTDTATSVPTYYVQPYLFDAFTNLATVDPALQAQAKARSCAHQVDCASVHPNATCGPDNTCVVDNLSPLNGADARGFARAVPLADGSVAIAGGLTLGQKDGWIATSASAEVFDPIQGYFRVVPEQAFVPVGLAQAVTDGAQAIVLVGGSQRVQFALTPGKSLTASLDSKSCPGQTCPVTNQIQRWDVLNGTLRSAPLSNAPGALPMVAKVHVTAAGQNVDRVLVAGGAAPPISKTEDSRQVQATLCDLTPKDAISCPPPGTRSMSVKRANAATACLAATADGACTSLLLLGGRKKAGALAELYDGTTDSFVPVTVKSDPTLVIHGGQLHRLATGQFLLVGATNSAPFIEDDSLTGVFIQPPTLVTVTTVAGATTIELTPVAMGEFAPDGQRFLATSVSLRDGSVLLMGGLDTNLNPLSTALRFGPDGQPIARLDLRGTRVSGSAALIGGKSALAGCVLLGGGFTFNATANALQPQNNVEAFCPVL